MCGGFVVFLQKKKDKGGGGGGDEDPAVQEQIARQKMLVEVSYTINILCA